MARFLRTRSNWVVFFIVCLLIAYGLSARGGEAPPSYAYLLQRISITTAAGITGIPVGTRVKLIERHADTVTVRSNQLQFDVPSDQLTNDSNAVRVLSQQDADIQLKLYQASMAPRRH